MVTKSMEQPELCPDVINCKWDVKSMKNNDRSSALCKLMHSLAMNNIFNKRLGPENHSTFRMCFSHALPWLQDESMWQSYPLHVFLCEMTCMCICVFLSMLLALFFFSRCIIHLLPNSIAIT